MYPGRAGTVRGQSGIGGSEEKSMKIDNDIPVPPHGRIRAPLTLAILQMRHGQSFLVETAEIRNRALRVGQTHGFTVVTRKENGAGYRIWKTDKPIRRKVGQPKRN